MGAGRTIATGLAIVLQTLFAWLLFSGLEAPLLWHDEADTAMFGRRILDYGYPKVHGPVNTTYGVQHPLEVGSVAGLDAYVGSPWGQYYFAAPAVAWSDGADGFAARTWRMRVPFVLAGWCGVLLLGVVGAAGWRRLGASVPLFWCGYGVALMANVSLQLHLREVRYYPLVVLALGLVAALELRRHASPSQGAPRPATLVLAGVLWLLFNLFYPAYAAVTLAAGAIYALRALPEPGWVARLRRFGAEAGPYLVAGLAVLPMALFYQIPQQSQAFLTAFRGEGHAWWPRFLDGGAYLLRYEWWAVAIVGVGWAVWGHLRRGGPDAATRPVLAGCGSVLLVVAVWWALVARTPFFYERYYVALSPLLACVGVLAAGLLWQQRSAASARVAGGVLAVLCLFSLHARTPDLAGRWSGMGERYRGPLDVAVRFVADLPPQERPLVVSTNYEDHSFMFYLGAKAVLGFYAPDRVGDRAVLPDVIIPRPWAKNQKALIDQARRASFEAHELPVANLKANNVPSLSERNQAKLVHRFVSPPPDAGFGPLRIYVRQEP